MFYWKLSAIIFQSINLQATNCNREKSELKFLANNKQYLTFGTLKLKVQGFLAHFWLFLKWKQTSWTLIKTTVLKSCLAAINSHHLYAKLGINFDFFVIMTSKCHVWEQNLHPIFWLVRKILKIIAILMSYFKDIVTNLPYNLLNASIFSAYKALPPIPKWICIGKF